jgi:pSer/pThr/pTyr-binding forkhead associated (FHA) protein
VEGSWFLRDLRSANGTSVNGWRVLGEVEVRPGDRVTFGAVTYRLGSPQR